MNLSVMRDGSERIHYQDPAVPIYICYGNLRELSNMAALCHWHEDVELLLPIRGHLAYNVNGTRLLVGEGNAVFVNSRQLHYGFSPDGTDCDYICVCFKASLLCAHKHLYDRYVLPILTNDRFPCFLLEKEKPDHAKLLDIIRDIADIRERDLALMGKLYALWQGIYALAEPEQAAPSDEDLRALRQMVAFVTARYPERICLAQIAAAGGVCRSKCCTVFKKYMGRTPNDYVNSYRLERAMELLREKALSITEVANACGFGSPSYFTEIFTRQKGCTPTAYRKQYFPGKGQG